MSEKSRFQAQMKALEGLCEEHHFSFVFKKESYPLTLSIRPLQGIAEQLTLLEDAEDGKERISQDAVMTFTKEDGDVFIRVFGTFEMSEGLQNKFKAIFKRLCEFFTLYFFRVVSAGAMPDIEWDEDNADDGE